MFQRSMSALSAIPALIVYLDSDLRLQFVNDGQHPWQESDRTALIGQLIWDVVGPDMRQLTEPKMREALTGQYVEHEFDVTVRGEPRCFRVSYSPDCDESGEVLGIVTLTTDLTERRTVEHELRNSQRTFDGAFRNAVIGKAIVALDGRCTRVNTAFAQMLGYTVDELVGVNFRDFTHPDDLEGDLALFNKMLAGDGDGYQIEKRYIHHNRDWVHVILSASVVRDDDGTPLHFVSEIVDITERKAQQEALRLLASTDYLTGLLNRRGFDEAVAEAFAAPHISSIGLGILIIDLDLFKAVNDRLGHAAGDAVLIQAGQRIARNVRSTDRVGRIGSDKVGRIGGDEYAVLLVDCSPNHLSLTTVSSQLVPASGLQSVPARTWTTSSFDARRMTSFTAQKRAVEASGDWPPERPNRRN
jgi:diguanylate cyclase (GGDEF)-like protein/PAS domain S-box-containing protein